MVERINVNETKLCDRIRIILDHSLRRQFIGIYYVRSRKNHGQEGTSIG